MKRYSKENKIVVPNIHPINYPVVEERLTNGLKFRKIGHIRSILNWNNKKK
jgi:hypothetical protein